MEDLQREMTGTSRESKLAVLRGLMQCIGIDGRATRGFELRLAGATVTVPQAQVVRAVLWMKSKVEGDHK